MILLLSLAVAVLIGLLRGGQLSRLGEVRLRWAGLAIVAVAVQLALMRWFPTWVGPASMLFPLTHLAILVVAWVNRELVGMRLLAIGFALNFLVMTVNGGFMPITPEALVQAGKAERVEDVSLFARRLPSKGLVMPREEIRLGWLSDMIPLRFPLKTVISLGDIWIAAGIFLFVQETMVAQKGLLWRREVHITEMG